MHERRADKLCGLIEERPRNAYEFAQEMWGNVAVTQAFLTLSEVLGHVDLLIDEGRVVEQESDGVVRFKPLETLEYNKLHDSWEGWEGRAWRAPPRIHISTCSSPTASSRADTRTSSRAPR